MCMGVIFKVDFFFLVDIWKIPPQGDIPLQKVTNRACILDNSALREDRYTQILRSDSEYAL
jgi:hypothetical protein